MELMPYTLAVKETLQRKREKRKRQSAFVNLRPLMGNFNWASFIFLIGAAQAGKSYAVMDYFLSQFEEKGITFTWFRLTEAQADKLLENKAEKLIDPDLRRRYNLDIVTNGNGVYSVKREEYEVHHKDGRVSYKTRIVEKKLMCRVLALSTFYGDKGAGYFDKDYEGVYNIGMDEFQPEKNEKRTFDIVYAFVRQLENLTRNKGNKVRLFACANLLEEASDLLCCFNFIPETYGVYKIKKKRCVMYYIEPSESYKEMRKTSIASLLLPNASMYSNEQKVDNTLIYKGRLHKPTCIIKFDKEPENWYTVWDSNIVSKYNKEKCTVYPMRPYLDEVYNTQLVNTVLTQFDNRIYKYRDLITFKRFQTHLSILKPRGH